MNNKLLIPLVSLLVFYSGMFFLHNKNTNIVINPFLEKICLLKENNESGNIHLFNDMSWITLNESLTKGYYYRKSEIIDQQVKICNLTIEFPDGYKIEQVEWDDIHKEVGWGHSIYYDYDVKKIWMFWVVGNKGKTLLITFCDVF